MSSIFSRLSTDAGSARRQVEMLKAKLNVEEGQSLHEDLQAQSPHLQLQEGVKGHLLPSTMALLSVMLC
jgi:hypothetical protein